MPFFLKEKLCPQGFTKQWLQGPYFSIGNEDATIKVFHCSTDVVRRLFVWHLLFGIANAVSAVFLPNYGPLAIAIVWELKVIALSYSVLDDPFSNYTQFLGEFLGSGIVVFAITHPMLEIVIHSHPFQFFEQC
jgi:hypothetical protein